MSPPREGWLFRGVDLVLDRREQTRDHRPQRCREVDVARRHRRGVSRRSRPCADRRPPAWGSTTSLARPRRRHHRGAANGGRPTVSPTGRTPASSNASGSTRHPAPRCGCCRVATRRLQLVLTLRQTERAAARRADQRLGPRHAARPRRPARRWPRRAGGGQPRPGILERTVADVLVIDEEPPGQRFPAASVHGRSAGWRPGAWALSDRGTLVAGGARWRCSEGTSSGGGATPAKPAPSEARPIEVSHVAVRGVEASNVEVGAQPAAARSRQGGRHAHQAATPGPGNSLLSAPTSRRSCENRHRDRRSRRADHRCRGTLARASARHRRPRLTPPGPSALRGSGGGGVAEERRAARTGGTLLSAYSDTIAGPLSPVTTGSRSAASASRTGGSGSGSAPSVLPAAPAAAAMDHIEREMRGWLQY